jgi:TolB-like protein
MAAGQPTDTQRPLPSVFLSYASEDRQAAQIIRDALPALGLDVWYDESALGGGEAWDQKIRKQIRECDFFMPIVSAQTEARHEGYFRREWRLAVERTLDMADDHIFLLPIVIDDTVDNPAARVPEKFLTVQWLRLPGGKPTAAFEALCRRLASGQATDVQPTRKVPDHTVKSHYRPPKTDYPEFPRQEAGQTARFYGQVTLWTVQSAWTFFQRFPRWVRVLVYVWLAIALVSKGCVSSDEDRHRPKRISTADTQKLKEISAQYLHGSGPPDIAGLAAQIARQFPDEARRGDGDESVLLAIPFSAPPGDQHAKEVADSIFAQVYGSAAIAEHGRIHLMNEPLSSSDPSVVAERGRANHSNYVVYGAIDNQMAAPSLTVKLIAAADGAEVWSRSYPVAGADAAKIAAEVVSKVPSGASD